MGFPLQRERQSIIIISVKTQNFGDCYPSSYDLSTRFVVYYILPLIIMTQNSTGTHMPVLFFICIYAPI